MLTLTRRDEMRCEPTETNIRMCPATRLAIEAVKHAYQKPSQQDLEEGVTAVAYIVGCFFHDRNSRFYGETPEEQATQVLHNILGTCLASLGYYIDEDEDGNYHTGELA